MSFFYYAPAVMLRKADFGGTVRVRSSYRHTESWVLRKLCATPLPGIVEGGEMPSKSSVWATMILCLFWMGCGSNPHPTTRNLLSISVQPSNVEAAAPSGNSPFTATGTFDQAPTTDDNLSVTWSSSDTTIATIDSGSGLATCIAAGGPVTITATNNQKQGTAQLNCVASQSSASGNCVYVCGSTRCGALTGYCSISTNNACKQVYAPGQCPTGQPAGQTATDSCGTGVDTSRSCSQ